MVGLIFTELSKEQSDWIKDFFKKNPRRLVCIIEIGGRTYKIKKAALKRGNIKLMGDL